MPANRSGICCHMSTVDELPGQEDILRNLQGEASATVEDLTAALEGGRLPPA